MAYSDIERRQIGVAVKRKRVNTGLSKEEAAARARLNSITWKKIEDGKSVRDASLGKVLSLLDIDADILLADDQRPAQSPVQQISDDDLLAELKRRLTLVPGNESQRNWGAGFPREDAGVSRDKQSG